MLWELEVWSTGETQTHGQEMVDRMLEADQPLEVFLAHALVHQANPVFLVITQSLCLVTSILGHALAQEAAWMMRKTLY